MLRGTKKLIVAENLVDNDCLSYPTDFLPLRSHLVYIFHTTASQDFFLILLYQLTSSVFPPWEPSAEQYT